MSDYKQTKTLVINGRVVTINSTWGDTGIYASIPQTANYGEPFTANVCVEYLTDSFPAYDGWSVYDSPYSADYAVAYDKEKLQNQDDYCYSYSDGIPVPSYLKRAEYIPYSANTSAGYDWWMYNDYIFPKEPTGNNPLGAFVIPKVSARNGLMVFANIFGQDVLDATPSGETKYSIHYYNLNYYGDYTRTFSGSYVFNYASVYSAENIFANCGEGPYFVIKDKNCSLIKNVELSGKREVNADPFGHRGESLHCIWSAIDCKFKNCSFLPINNMYNCDVRGGTISASLVYSDKPYGNAKKCNLSAVDLDSYSYFEDCNITGVGYNNNEYATFRNCNLENMMFSYNTNSAYNCVLENCNLYRGHYVNCTITGGAVYPAQLYLTNCTVNGVYYAQTSGME